MSIRVSSHDFEKVFSSLNDAAKAIGVLGPSLTYALELGENSLQEEATRKFFFVSRTEEKPEPRFVIEGLPFQKIIEAAKHFGNQATLIYSCIKQKNSSILGRKNKRFLTINEYKRKPLEKH